MAAKKVTAAMLLGSDAALTAAEAAALAAEYAAASNVEGLAAFRKARVAYVVRMRTASGKSADGGAYTMADLLRSWRATGVELSSARVSQYAAEVATMLAAGFDVSADSALTRDAYRVAVAIRKITYGAGDAAQSERQSDVSAALAEVAGDLDAFSAAADALRAAATAYRAGRAVQGATAGERPGAADAHGETLAVRVADDKGAWLALLSDLVGRAESGAFALTSAESERVAAQVARIVDALGVTAGAAA